MDWIVEASALEWHGNRATIVNHKTEERGFVEAHTLDITITNSSMGG